MTANVRSREQQVDNVRTGNQKNRGDSAHQDEQRRAHASRDQLLNRQRISPGESALKPVETPLHPTAGDQSQLARCGCPVNASCQTPHPEVRPITPGAQICAVDDEGEPYLGGPIRAIVERKAKRFRHYSDHCSRAAVDPNRAPNQVRCAAESPLP
jgi:hypothetical protein